MRRPLQRGADSTTTQTAAGTLLLVRTTWNEGPCAFIGTIPPVWRRLPRTEDLFSWGVLCVGLLLAVLIAAGPVVRRIHALTDDVRRSAAEHYAESVRVTGSDEIAALARAFNEAAGQVRSRMIAIQEREETLRTFLANTTHDVMLPLTVLQGHLAELKRLVSDPTAGALAATPQVVAAASDETEYVASLLQNLTAAAKLEAGTLVESHEVDLSQAIERVVQRFARLAAARGIELGHAVPTEPPVRVIGDVTLIEQAVGNLLQNAIRHNSPGGHVAVVLDADKDDGFVLRIADDGPGVAAADRPRLGERRFRAEAARQRHPEGLGIGLSIVRSVAHRHGYALTFLESDPHGLTVELRGPRASTRT